MNKSVVILSIAVALLLSCTRESGYDALQSGKTMTFTAEWAGEEDTRTVLWDDGTSIWWMPREEINVFFGNKASGIFTSTNDVVKKIVDFRGSLSIIVGSVETDNPSHAYWAVYPYNSTNQCDGESVILTVPSSQSTNLYSFADKLFPAIATSTNFHLAFYNVCGGVRFSVSNSGITSVTFKSNIDVPLAGKVQVGFGSEGVPEVRSVLEGSSEVTAYAPSGGFVPGEYYYIALLPQTLSDGVSMTFRKADGKAATVSLDHSITINRSRFGTADEKDRGLEFKDEGGGQNPPPSPSDHIVFVDDRVKTKLVARFDTDGDGELSYEEAAAVTSADEVKAAFGTIRTYKHFDEFQYFTGIEKVSFSMFSGWNNLESITIPNSVTLIDGYAFSGCSSLVSVSIPDSVVKIGDSVFEGCVDLPSIVLPKRMDSIGVNLFSGCTGLVSAVLPESVEYFSYGCFVGCTSLVSVSLPNSDYLPSQLFDGCSSLMSVSIPESIRGIDNYAFRGCTSLTAISIPDAVSNIGEGAFYDCTSLTSIVLPECLTAIDKYLFEKCSNLVSVSIQGRVTSIGSCAFEECRSLVDCRIPSSVTSIGNYAFESCSSLVNVTIPEGVTEIPMDAFTDCSSLRTVILPESLKSIGRYAFGACTSLAAISLPQGLTNLDYYAFYRCTSLESVSIPAGVKRLKVGCFEGCSGLVSVTIPEGMEQMEREVFKDCSSLLSIRLPESMTSIPMTAFSGCTSLSSVQIPESITLIDAVAFENCVNLRNIDIPESVITIGGGAFSGCTGLSSILIPKSVTSLGRSAFGGCSGLGRITMSSVNPPSIFDNTFEQTNDCPIYVPAQSVGSYKSEWPVYASRIVAGG